MGLLTFYKLCATGNDFILVDNREKTIRQVTKAARGLCHRNHGIGADGLILLEKSRKADLKMRIINQDGSEAEMCGNGIRAAAWTAHHIFKCAPALRFETLAGVVTADVAKNAVTARLSDPTDFRDYAPLEVADGIFYFYFLNTGVPHVVIFEENIDDFPVEKIGREIRHHPHFQPQGANVNFVQIKNKNTIVARTYERGVEAETLACGTGSTASAIMSAVIGKCSSPVTVYTRGGEKLVVSFDMHKFEITNVFLKGDVQFVFQGEVRLPS
jgi:diaminopimelate epimerase